MLSVQNTKEKKGIMQPLKNILVLDGNMEHEGDSFSLHLNRITDLLKQNNEVRIFQLNKMNLQYCTGCWSCWWKTPGSCIIKDGAEEIFHSFIHSDLVIFASPIKAGFTSSALKKITDRLIVLVHPYIQIINKECHHRKRYDSYPDFGVLLSKETDTDTEDVEIINNIYKRLAINLHSRMVFSLFANDINDVDFINNPDIFANRPKNKLNLLELNSIQD